MVVVVSGGPPPWSRVRFAGFAALDPGFLGRISEACARGGPKPGVFAHASQNQGSGPDLYLPPSIRRGSGTESATTWGRTAQVRAPTPRLRGGERAHPRASGPGGRAYPGFGGRRAQPPGAPGLSAEPPSRGQGRRSRRSEPLTPAPPNATPRPPWNQVPGEARGPNRALAFRLSAGGQDTARNHHGQGSRAKPGS